MLANLLIPFLLIFVVNLFLWTLIKRKRKKGYCETPKKPAADAYPGCNVHSDRFPNTDHPHDTPSMQSFKRTESASRCFQRTSTSNFRRVENVTILNMAQKE